MNVKQIPMLIPEILHYLDLLYFFILIIFPITSYLKGTSICPGSCGLPSPYSSPYLPNLSLLDLPSWQETPPAPTNLWLPACYLSSCTTCNCYTAQIAWISAELPDLSCNGDITFKCFSSTLPPQNLNTLKHSYTCIRFERNKLLGEWQQTYQQLHLMSLKTELKMYICSPVFWFNHTHSKIYIFHHLIHGTIWSAFCPTQTLCVSSSWESMHRWTISMPYWQFTIKNTLNFSLNIVAKNRFTSSCSYIYKYCTVKHQETSVFTTHVIHGMCLKHYLFEVIYLIFINAVMFIKYRGKEKGEILEYTLRDSETNLIQP